MPLIQLDYGVDTDAGGSEDRSAMFTLTPSHLPDRRGSPVRGADRGRPRVISSATGTGPVAEPFPRAVIMCPGGA
ncbi:hypothetical protein GCM10023193_59650 [Planotetraspora kaengkrachanensis]